MANYYVYIITNRSKKYLYIGITNNLHVRLRQHFDTRGTEQTWAGRHFCFILIYFEEFKYVYDAIAREKQLKGWRREKKEKLIFEKNPDWLNLNEQFA